MKSLQFIWKEKSSLLRHLSRPFARFSVETDMGRRPVAIRLHHNSGTVTRICSQMHDIGPRTEVGVLEFSTTLNRYEKELAVDIPNRLGDITSIEKLVIAEKDVQAESGIVFKNARQEEMVFVASAAPYVLAISVPWDAPELKFDPEYPLEQYRRIALS
jgi:hypothetical protein